MQLAVIITDPGCLCGGVCYIVLFPLVKLLKKKNVLLTFNVSKIYQNISPPGVYNIEQKPVLVT